MSQRFHLFFSDINRGIEGLLRLNPGEQEYMKIVSALNRLTIFAKKALTQIFDKGTPDWCVVFFFLLGSRNILVFCNGFIWRFHGILVKLIIYNSLVDSPNQCTSMV